MAIHKLKKHISNSFTVVDNETFMAISAEDGLAAAIWVYLQSKPEDWIVRPADVQRHFKIGRKSYYARLKVLRAHGVYWNTSDTGPDGKFRNGVIHVSAVPVMVAGKEDEPSDPEGHPVESDKNCQEPSAPEGHPGDPNRYTGKGESGSGAPLQKKDYLQKKDSTKSGKATRDMSLDEMLSWRPDRGFTS